MIGDSVIYCWYCPHKLNTRFSLSHISFCSADVSMGKWISDKLGWHSEINDNGNKFNCLSPEIVWESSLFGVSFSSSLLQWFSSSINSERLFIINNVANKKAFPLKNYSPFKRGKNANLFWLLNSITHWTTNIFMRIDCNILLSILCYRYFSHDQFLHTHLLIYIILNWNERTSKILP